MCVCVCVSVQPLYVQHAAQNLQPPVGLMQILFYFIERWNSTLSMISWYLRNQEAVNATFARQKHNLATLTNLECSKLQKLEVVLEPCKYDSPPPHTHVNNDVSSLLHAWRGHLCFMLCGAPRTLPSQPCHESHWLHNKVQGHLFKGPRHSHGHHQQQMAEGGYSTRMRGMRYVCD